MKRTKIPCFPHAAAYQVLFPTKRAADQSQQTAIPKGTSDITPPKLFAIVVCWAIGPGTSKMSLLAMCFFWFVYMWDQGFSRNVFSDFPDYDDDIKLCQLKFSECEEKQKKKISKLAFQDGRSVSSLKCDITRTYLDCVEDYICSGCGNDNIQVMTNFQIDLRRLATECHPVSGYTHRKESIQCQGNEDLTREDVSTDIKTSPEDDLPGRFYQVSSACPDVTYCYNVSMSYQSRSMTEVMEVDRETVHCEGLRLTIVCINDALCSCGLTDDPQAVADVTSLKYQYQQLCQQGKDAVLDGQRCPKSDNLCDDFLLTCERRVLVRYQHLVNSTDYTYVSCETFKTRIQCFEDFICTCTESNVHSLRITFEDYKKPYEEHCLNVPGHKPREGHATCMDKDFLKYIANLNSAAQRWKRKCPALKVCHQKKSQGHLPRHSQCRNIKEQLLCQVDLICNCRAEDQHKFWETTGSLLYLHNVTCKEEVFVDRTVCKGFKTYPGLWLILGALFLLTTRHARGCD